MPNTDVIVACASCGTQYNVSSMAPGAKFKCQKCSTINIVPAGEEPIKYQSPPPPRPQARPQVKLPVKAGPKPTPAPSRISGSRVPASKASVPLKRGKIPTRKSEENEEAEMGAIKGGIMAKENRKYIYIGGAVLLVILAVVYVMHSNSVAARDKQTVEDVAKKSKEIIELLGAKDYATALEKIGAFIKEFRECEIPEVKKNVENTEKSIKGIEQKIELEKEGKGKLANLMEKKSNTPPDQYEDLIKELTGFRNNYAEFSQLFSKADSELKDIETKVAAKQEEEDTKAYNDLMAEIKPMVNDGKIDAAITYLKKYWDDTPKISKRLQGALKKKLSELKAMK
ncbi:MAG: hypothetical protein HZA49_00360 [Planctomycetes bacterium]|nr:hypothetical protein [Planctomycetota bacterium]